MRACGGTVPRPDCGGGSTWASVCQRSGLHPERRPGERATSPFRSGDAGKAWSQGLALPRSPVPFLLFLAGFSMAPGGQAAAGPPTAQAERVQLPGTWGEGPASAPPPALPGAPCRRRAPPSTSMDPRKWSWSATVRVGGGKPAGTSTAPGSRGVAPTLANTPARGPGGSSARGRPPGMAPHDVVTATAPTAPGLHAVCRFE